jgi:transposase-like protein
MIFPITELLDEQASLAGLEQHCHAKGRQCPRGGAGREEAREFRKHKKGLSDYRCHHCQRPYNLYTGTLFAGSNLAPRRVVLLIRGGCKGEPARGLAEELALSRQGVQRWRQRLQAHGYTMLSAKGLPDAETETDEMFQNAGEKRRQPLRSVRSAAASRQQATRPRHL